MPSSVNSLAEASNYKVLGDCSLYFLWFRSIVAIAWLLVLPITRTLFFIPQEGLTYRESTVWNENICKISGLCITNIVCFEQSIFVHVGSLLIPTSKLSLRSISKHRIAINWKNSYYFLWISPNAQTFVWHAELPPSQTNVCKFKCNVWSQFSLFSVKLCILRRLNTLKN